MLKSLNRDPDAEPRKILENINDAINDYVEDAPQFDIFGDLDFEVSIFFFLSHLYCKGGNGIINE